MPEGDTLRRLADRVSNAYVGQQVLGCTFRHPRLALADLSGTTLRSVDATGKHLLSRFSNGKTLHLHLLMAGRVFLSARPDVPEWRRRFEIQFETGLLTGVDVPLLHLFDTTREEQFVGHLGPDLCGAYDHDVAVARVEAAADMHLSAALLDQRVVAGFGNIYAVETPFICGLNPFTKVGAIESIEPIMAIGAALIRTNAMLGPQNTTGKRLSRSDQWVLPAKVRTCKLCGATLERMSEGQTPWRRRTAFCPQCQPQTATTPDLDRAKQLLGLHPARRMLDLPTCTLIADTSSAVVAKS